MRNVIVLSMLVLASCGQQPTGSRIEYYVEDSSQDPDQDQDQNQGNTNTTDDTNNQNSDNASGFSLAVNDPSEALADGIVTIQLDVKNPPTGLTWRAYFSTKEDGSDPTPISTDTSISTMTQEWDVSDLEAGTYYLFIETSVAGKTQTFKPSNPLMIDASGNSSNTKPSIKLDFPLGENVLVAGAPQNIRWTATDAEGDDLSYKVEYSADGGSTWTALADDVKEASYSWDVAGLAQGITYKVKVSATDSKGASNFATSTKNFGVATKAMTFAAGFGELMVGRCDSCHAAGRVNQNQFRSDSYDLANIGVSDKTNNIKNRIENGTMPPNNPLGAADRAVLTMWLWGGAQ